MEVLSFQCAEEAFNRCVVESVAFAAHALLDAMTRQHRSVGMHLEVPTLVGVHDQVSGGLGARALSRACRKDKATAADFQTGTQLVSWRIVDLFHGFGCDAGEGWGLGCDGLGEVGPDSPKVRRA